MLMGLLWGFCGVVLRSYGIAVGLYNVGNKNYLWILCVGNFYVIYATHCNLKFSLGSSLW